MLLIDAGVALRIGWATCWARNHFGGFTACVNAITVVYALILLVLLLVPPRLIDTADGQIPEVAPTATKGGLCRLKPGHATTYLLPRCRESWAPG
jgi:hypothetical protein